MRIVDSECRLAALEALLLLVDAGPLSAATVAARRNVVDLAAAVIAAAHARYAEPPALASGPAEPPAARPPVYEHARGGLCCVGKLPSDIAAPPLPPTDDTGDRLAPPRSVRAETVRIAAALLAALAHADIDARARVKALAPLLVPVAATDEAKRIATLAALGRMLTAHFTKGGRLHSTHARAHMPIHIHTYVLTYIQTYIHTHVPVSYTHLTLPTKA